MKTHTKAFEVLDALGLAQLVKRREDLGGSAPLRAVQGCLPLLEGNAFGFQICLRHPISLRRISGGVAVEIEPPYHEAFAIGHRAVLPRLAAQGFLAADSLLATEFADDFVKVRAADSDDVRVRLWTGLCVRADPGVWLRVSGTANRRNRFVEVEGRFITDDGQFAPLVLDLKLPPYAPDRVYLAGEIGTLAPVAPGARIDDVSLAEAPEIGAAHAAFYNEAYFDAKRGEVTRKYRKMKPLPEAPEGGAPVRCRVITVGPQAHTIGGPIPCIAFANPVPFEATYDGYTLTVEPEHSVLRAGARLVEQTFAEALGPTFLGENPRAMLYFTNYFSPHPPGEPHFFVKPWAFMQTPPGWSCLLEGVHGDGFDVLRGVVATDVFHALPAVFQVYRTGKPIRMGLGEPLLQVMPIPRHLLQAGFRQVTLRG
jgi:hypothetical protein